MKKFLSIATVILLIMVIGCGKLADEHLMELGKDNEEKEQFTEAISNYEKVVKLYPESEYCSEALHRTGLVYANGIQDFEKAVSYFQRVIDEHPESKFAAISQFMIGFTYANSTMDTSKAKEAYEIFIEKYPDHELVSSVEFELKYLGKDINDITELMSLEEKNQE